MLSSHLFVGFRRVFLTLDFVTQMHHVLSICPVHVVSLIYLFLPDLVAIIMSTNERDLVSSIILSINFESSVIIRGTHSQKYATLTGDVASCFECTDLEGPLYFSCTWMPVSRLQQRSTVDMTETKILLTS